MNDPMLNALIMELHVKLNMDFHGSRNMEIPCWERLHGNTMEIVYQGLHVKVANMEPWSYSMLNAEHGFLHVSVFI